MELWLSYYHKRAIKRASTISYNSEFFDSAVFIVNSLSNIVDNIAEGIDKVKWKLLRKLDKINY